MPTALTIGGSDSSAGAGIQADLKTFFAHGVYGMSAITAVTAQNTLGVQAVLPLPVDMVVAQIDAVIADLGVSATKVGMLATAGITTAVTAAIIRHRLRPLVLDTVMAATGGGRLLDDEALAPLRLGLMPLAEVVTVNLAEVEVLTGVHVDTVIEAREAARRLVRDGARRVVVKGGHLRGPATDVFFDGHAFVEFDGARIESSHTHGTGCTFASAIAAHLALGAPLVDAIGRAKAYVARAIAAAPRLGGGHGPLGHDVAT